MKIFAAYEALHEKVHSNGFDLSNKKLGNSKKVSRWKYQSKHQTHIARAIP